MAKIPATLNFWLHIFIPILISVLLNGLIFSMGWDGVRGGEQSLLPPPWLIGTLWVVWLGFMGWAKWIVSNIETDKAHKAGLWIIALMVYCWLYPFYALAPEGELGIMLGNIGSIFLTAYVFYRVRSVSLKASRLIFPIIIWVVYATIASAY